MEIHIYGSTVRGEIHSTSDIDIFAIPVSGGLRTPPKTWSVYSKETLNRYFEEGKLFAWHLFLESKLIYSPLPSPFLHSLGEPAPYMDAKKDIKDLSVLLQKAISELCENTPNTIFELGIVYTAIRDIAMSSSWALLGSPKFSSDTPYILPIPCPIPKEIYDITRLSRHNSTRGYNLFVDLKPIIKSVISSPIIEWSQKVGSLV